ncbi:unnamed protein product, partial [Lymnaea stagnalis]
DQPYIPDKPKPAPSPCYLHFCPFGATCHVNATTKLPVCVCEQRCSQVFAPVCGSDGATYTNLCMLERTACVRNRRIRLSSEGPCGLRDPCEGQVCKFGAECMSSMDGKIARCQCPSDCPSYGDNVGSKPVCGNDGNDYANMCELRKAACYRLEDIRVKYYGKCDPCEGHVCDSPKVCQVNAQREPECRCSFHCSTEINLVCGSDGRSYSNQCLLRKQACKSRKDIRVLYIGKCTPDNPCMQIQCGPEEECSVDRSGQAVCVCPPPCEPVLRRVCGNDSTTYDNECELRRTSCLEKVYVVVKHPGPCGEPVTALFILPLNYVTVTALIPIFAGSDSVCRDHYCGYGAVCVEHNGKAVCECPQCTEEYKPVCGDNAITYQNECKMRQENCQREESVKVKQEGACAEGCGNQRCEYYAVCESMNGKPRCVCPTSCVKASAPICGNDGVTYENECELRVEACRRKKLLTISSIGTCDKCKNITCNFHAKCENGICVCPILCATVNEPVCGTDDVTYHNECEMRKHSCTQNTLVSVRSLGRCDDEPFSGSGDFSGNNDDSDTEPEATKTPSRKVKACTNDNCVEFGGTCELDGLVLKCSCSFECKAVREYVCGSNGRTYGSRCALLLESCLTKTIIKEQPSDNCDDLDDTEPCDGAAPLINPSTRDAYNCSEGICPANSYCHAKFSKCCRKESAPITSCTEMALGCCKDGITPANDLKQRGCPDVCNCNPMGSFSTTCDPKSKQCTCKPGVGGKRCDRCEIGYWGLHKIGETGGSGCIPCNCNKFGSYRDDCDQMTGRCMCKPNIMGMKCDRCPNGKVLGPEGCRDQFTPVSCDDLTCRYGATCREEPDGTPACFCDHKCDASSHPSEIVCSTDGQNFGSLCQLQYFACRLQQDISVANTGSCKGAPPVPATTISPVTKSRKTTRHIDGSGDPYTKNTSSVFSKVTTSQEQEQCTGANIDNLCLSNDDCCPRHSHCRSGLCYCMDGYIPSQDNTQCYEVKTRPTEKVDNLVDACTNNPCHFGTCVLDKTLGYRCACPLGKTGTLCKRNQEFTTPSFSGRSHLEVRRIDKATQELSIDIVFAPLNKDGIILFNSQNKDGSGDFVSLTMNDGYVEFRFDLGAGPAILRSRDPVEPIRSHRVIARRVKESGILIVDNDEAVTGSSPFTLTALDLGDPMYLGYIPRANKEIFDKVGVDLGLVGCIHSLRAGSPSDMYAYNLAYSEDFSDLKAGVDITECGSNPCKSMPCKNGGTCLALDTQIFECRCPNGYKGRVCENLVNPCASQPCSNGGKCVPMTSTDGFYCQCATGFKGPKCESEAVPEVFVPQFTGDSYLEIPIQQKLSNARLTITIWFMATKPDGLLLLMTQSPGGKGDFIAITLENKILVFTFFLGSGVGRVE